ncbi:MAG: hypothetical protein H7039_11720 [Bryobacteraceae bacterium]|nr:hypothetical protein [Bryobacteraceae bacterium]
MHTSHSSYQRLAEPVAKQPAGRETTLRNLSERHLGLRVPGGGEYLFPPGGLVQVEVSDAEVLLRTGLFEIAEIPNEV